MNQIGTLLFVVIVVILIIIVFGALFCGSHKSHNVIPPSVFTEMNVLWQDNVSISREYMILVSHKDGNAPGTLDRLKVNQATLGHNLTKIYGSQAGSAYTSLLEEGVDCEAGAINDIKAGRDPNPNISLWMVNAGKTTKLLNMVSHGCIREDIMNRNFNNYINATVAQTRSIVAGKYDDAKLALSHAQASAADISTSIQRCAQSSGRKL